MIVLPGVRRSGANAAGASASGRTAPTIVLSRPSLSRWARSASRDRSVSTTKKMARPSLGWTVGTLMVVTSVPPARTSAAEDLAADHVEHHVNFTNLLQLVGLQVQEDVHSQSEGGFAVRCPSSANHDGSDFAGELHRDRTDTARGAVDQDGLACREVGVVDERLPRRQPGDRQGSGHGVIDVSRKGSEVARLHCAVFGQGAVASPVAQAEYPLAHTRPVVPYPSSTTTPDSSWPGTLGVRSRPVRSTQVPDQSSSPGVNPAACTPSMTSFWAACG